MATTILFLMFATAGALCFRRWMVDALVEGIDNFVNNFRGGPPAPMHPSPANDSFILRKRRSKAEN
jgi:hypothetical protein